MSRVNLLRLQKHADLNSADQLLEKAVSMILNDLPNLRSVEVFRLVYGGMVLWHGANSAHTEGSFVAFDDNLAYLEAINRDDVVQDDANQSLIAPLADKHDVFALLVLGYEDEVPTEQVSKIAEELAMLLYNQQVNALLQQQIALTGKLSIASSLIQVASILAETIVKRQQFISMNLFLYDEDEAVSGARVIATANRNQTYPNDLMLNISVSSLKLLHQLLLEEGEMIISDVTTDERFNDENKLWLQEQNIMSIYIIPLWIHNKIHAFIGLADSQRTITLSDQEKELFQNAAHQAANAIEKQRLLEETQNNAIRADEQVRVLSRLNELIAHANRQQSEEPILQKTAEVLHEVTKVDHVNVIMLRGSEGVIITEAPQESGIGRPSLADVQDFHNIMAETRNKFVVLNVEENERILPEIRDILLKLNIKSFVVLPMFDENEQLMGHIGLNYLRKQARIDPSVIQTAQTIVTQIALTLQKIRLLAVAQQKAEQLERLTEFGQSLRSHLGTEEILRTTLEYCPQIMGADYVGVLLYDRASNTIRQSASHFLSEDRVQMDAGRVTEEDNSIALRAWSSHELVKVDDLHVDWEWKHRLHRELQSILAIPLTLAGVMLGVMEVGSPQPHHFNETDVTTLRQISNQLAIALSNASAYSQSQRLARNKSQANEIITKLQEQLEVNDILNVTVKELGKALGAKSARIRLGTAPKKEETDS